VVVQYYSTNKSPVLLQEVLARLSPRAIKASPADACVVMNTFQGISWHIQGHSSATALGEEPNPMWSVP